MEKLPNAETLLGKKGLLEKIDFLISYIEAFKQKYVNFDAVKLSGLNYNIFLSEQVLDNHIKPPEELTEKDIRDFLLEKGEFVSDLKFRIFDIIISINFVYNKSSYDVFGLSVILGIDLKSDDIDIGSISFRDHIIPNLNLNLILSQLQILKRVFSKEPDDIDRFRLFISKIIDGKMNNQVNYTQGQAELLNILLSNNSQLADKIQTEISVLEDRVIFSNGLGVFINGNKLGGELFSLSEIEYMYNFLSGTDESTKRLFLKNFCFIDTKTPYLTLEGFSVSFGDKGIIIKELGGISNTSTQEEKYITMLLGLNSVDRELIEGQVTFFENHIRIGDINLTPKNFYSEKDVDGKTLLSVEEIKYIYEFYPDPSKRFEFMKSVCYFSSVDFRGNKQYYLCSDGSYVHIGLNGLEILEKAKFSGGVVLYRCKYSS